MAFLTKTAAILDLFGTLNILLRVWSEKDPQMRIASPYKGNKFSNEVNNFIKKIDDLDPHYKTNELFTLVK